MSDSGFALSNEELTDLIRTTFVFTVLSASLDNEERDDMPQKVGEYVIEACMDDMMSNVVENTFSNKKAFDLESIDFESFIQSLDDEFDLTVEAVQHKFNSYKKDLKIKVLGSVYRALMLDGKISEVESEFLNETLEEAGITLAEVKEHLSGLISVDEMSAGINAMSEELDKED